MRAVSFIWGEMKTIANENWARDIISWKHLTIGRPVLPVFPRAQSLIPDIYSVLFTDSVEGQQLQHLMILPLLRSMASTHGKCQFVGDRSMFPPLETGGNMIVGWLWCCVTARASSQKASTEALDLFEFSFLSLLAALFISDCPEPPWCKEAWTNLHWKIPWIWPMWCGSMKPMKRCAWSTCNFFSILHPCSDSSSQSLPAITKEIPKAEATNQTLQIPDPQKSSDTVNI